MRKGEAGSSDTAQIWQPFSGLPLFKGVRTHACVCVTRPQVWLGFLGVFLAVILAVYMIATRPKTEEETILQDLLRQKRQ